MSALPKPPLEDATVAAARAFADVLVAQPLTPEEIAVLAFVRGASYAIAVAEAVMRGRDDNVPGWPKT
jgi:hypothetical protein